FGNQSTLNQSEASSTTDTANVQPSTSGATQVWPSQWQLAGAAVFSTCESESDERLPNDKTDDNKFTRMMHIEYRETEPSTSSAKVVDQKSNSNKDGSEPKLENEEQDKPSEVALPIEINQKPCYESDMLTTCKVLDAAMDQVKDILQ